MKFLSVKFVISLLLVLAFGCSSISELTKDGIGQPISTVIDRYGSPTRVISDEKGASIYIWEHWVDTGYGSGHLWSTTFWVDSNGIIYGWN
jgi:hypothetical protein